MKAVIFDLDGVICSSDKYHFQAWKTLADELGVYFDKEINNRLRGAARMESLEIILERAEKKYSEEEKLAFADKKNTLYRRLLSNITNADISAGARETLTELRKRGYLLAIGSSSKNAKFILERLGLCNFFDAISDGNNILRSKPDPETFLCAAETLGLPPGECVVVEDAFAGIDAAAAGKFKCAGIGNAADYGKTDWKIEKLSDLLKYLPPTEIYN